ncbi:multipass membrane protein [Candidatus Mancarchaeum acidiphilum]|uniref:Multipass membrane protein n=1 Tax=Candidatus Mancarchaeum acidiphilum TaxID=1920749 RepID=A0A218NLX1_9ARCH|nr:hypothetical protein [Candidatus Mancarchaeum acidiphilum]ASI13468.1 multipass membrane protein [Candidatus Mancarchaeum acidiphilum]
MANKKNQPKGNDVLDDVDVSGVVNSPYEGNSAIKNNVKPPNYTPPPSPSSLSNVYEQKSYETDFTEEGEISGPLTLWIGAMVVGIVLIIASTLSIFGPVQSIMYKIGYYIIYLPGTFIFPLIVGAWLGNKTARPNMLKSIKASLINSIYASIIYSIAVLIIYLILYYTSNLLSKITVSNFSTMIIGIPILIVIIVGAVINFLRSARHHI